MAGPITWPILLSVAAPFIVALGVIGRYWMKKLDQYQTELRELYIKVLTDMLTAITSSTQGLNSNTKSLEVVMEFIETLRHALQEERDLRVRLQTLLDLQGRLPRAIESARSNDEVPPPPTQ